MKTMKKRVVRTVIRAVVVVACVRLVIAQGATPALGQLLPLGSGKVASPISWHEVESTARSLPKGTPYRVLVQLDSIPTAVERSDLHASGIRLLDYVGDRTWFASVTSGDRDAKTAVAGVRRVLKILPETRLAPSLCQGMVPDHAVATDGQWLLAILAFEDVDLNVLADEIRQLGGTVDAVSLPFETIFIRAPQKSVYRISQLQGIHWMEPIAPQPGSEMDRARVYLNADNIPLTPYSLTGAGVEVSINDTGHAWDNHPDLAGRWIHGDAGVDVLNVTSHPSTTAGTIAGDGTLVSVYRGFAPGATVVTYSYADPDDPVDTTMANLLGDLELALQRGIDVGNNSWGFFCNELPYGDYTTQARAFDRQVLGLDGNGNAIGEPTVVVFSGGNERNGSGNGRTDCITNNFAPYINYATINQPKSAKNIIVVGAVDSVDDRMTTYSSWGPTADGRLRPDVVAAGHHNGTNSANASDINNCFGIPTGAVNQQCYRATNDNLEFEGYAWFAQTSAAAAMVSGISALLIEDFRSLNAGQNPLPSTVKALLIHTAVDLDDSTSWYNPGPDYASGYGRVNVHAAVDQLRSGGVIENCVDHGQTNSIALPIPPGAGDVKVTLVWSDVPASPSTTAPALVNDLDLVVTDGNRIRHYPWTLNPASPANDAVRTVEDHLNNVEVVLADASVFSGSWNVDVVGTSVPDGPQCYSLVYSTFLRAPGFVITQIDVPDATSTEAFGINDSGTIVGTYDDADGNGHGFHFTSDGRFQTDDVIFSKTGHVVLTDINNTIATGKPGGTTGTLCPCDEVTGYVRPFDLFEPIRPFARLCFPGDRLFASCYRLFPDIEIPGATGDMFALAVNNNSKVGGIFGDATGKHGFLFDAFENVFPTPFTQIDFPGAHLTDVGAIADDGTIGGTYVIGARRPAGFIYDGTDFTTVNVPGASVGTRITGINDEGHMVAAHSNNPLRLTGQGSFFDGSTWVEIDIVGASTASAWDLNTSDQIVGRFTNATGRHGFLATPIPDNTPVGTNVVARPVDTTTGTTPVTVTFDEVTAEGDTRLTTINAGHTIPSGFQLCDPPTLYDLTTTATPAAGTTIEVCIDYRGVTCDESALTLNHFEDTNEDNVADRWVDVTSSLDTVNDIICGVVSELSLFALFEPAPAPVCGNGVLAEGEDCDDGSANGTPDSCCTTTCVFKSTGTPCTDTDGNECMTAGCDGVGVCDQNQAMADDATGCDDSDACTTSDACSAGVCVGGATRNCDDDNPCTDDDCDTLSGCMYSNTFNGTFCDDGDDCTTDDICMTGICAGTVVTLGDLAGFSRFVDALTGPGIRVASPLPEVTFEWVTVGNAGNEADPLNARSVPGIGSVNYVYRIAKHEVTNDQYEEFLNAVAATDMHALYNPSMGQMSLGGITQSGSSGSFTYIVKTNMGNKPVIYVSFFDAMRFVNWLHNGQPTGAQDVNTTEDGVHAITDGLSETRAADARFFIPTENEWYKAAYHQPSDDGGDNDDYWVYPTASNSLPTEATAGATGNISNPGTNIANYNRGADWNGQDGNLTTVGSAGPWSETFYGTSDQGGNVWEWNETMVSGSNRILRGGGWGNVDVNLRSSNPTTLAPGAESRHIGFRVASPFSTCTADLDGDGNVDMFDFWLFQVQFTGP